MIPVTSEEGPLRLNLIGVRPANHTSEANVQEAKASEVPLVEGAKPHGRPLAIVGGGPSFVDHMEEFRAWPGDIWAVSGAGRVLRENGIESIAVSIDAGHLIESLFDGKGEALFATSCHPNLFAKYKGRCRAFPVVDVPGDPDAVITAKGGATTTSRLHFIAFHMGYGELHYFGCEGNYGTKDGDQKYAYATPTWQHPRRQPWIMVRAGDREFLTDTSLYLQSWYLAPIFMEFPEVFRDRSGGLLGGMINHPATWSVVAVEEPLLNHLAAIEMEEDHGEETSSAA